MSNHEYHNLRYNLSVENFCSLSQLIDNQHLRHDTIHLSVPKSSVKVAKQDNLQAPIWQSACQKLLRQQAFLSKWRDPVPLFVRMETFSKNCKTSSVTIYRLLSTCQMLLMQAFLLKWRLYQLRKARLVA